MRDIDDQSMENPAMAQPASAHQSSKDEESPTTIQDGRAGEGWQQVTMISRSPKYTASWTQRRLEAIKALHRSSIRVTRNKLPRWVWADSAAFGRWHLSQRGKPVEKQRKSLKDRILDAFQPKLRLPLAMLVGAGVTIATTVLLVRHVQRLIVAAKVCTSTVAGNNNELNPV